MTWDEKTQTLFSGDLFGAITSSPGLIADESYREPMKAFHEHYIPSHEVLMPVMDSLLALDIRLIAPQHGKVITEDIRRCILELRSLKCGAYLSMNGQPLSREPETNQLPLERILNLLVDRLAGLFGSETVRKTFVRTPFRLRDDVLQFESLPGTGSTTAGTAASGGPETDDIISLFIEQIVLANSLRWYSLIEPYLFGLLAEYRIPLPRWVLDTAIITAPAGEEPVNNEERVLHDRKTGLYNGIVYRQYLDSIRKRKSTAPYGILCFSVDNLEEINQLYGRRAGDEALKALVYLLKNAVNNDPAWIFFKLEMPYIACIADNVPPGRIREMAEQVRYAASEAEFTPEKLVISAGILYVDQGNGQPGEEETEHIDRILLARLFRARKSPSGGICDYLRETDMNLFLRRKILLVEPDESYIRFLEPYFTAHGYHLMAVSDGTEALKLRDDETPDLIIAEAMAPRMNGFELRERMLTSSYGRQIPFILVSRRKDEEFIRRAAAAGILLFLKKPFSKTELLGLVDNLLRQDS
jgi:Response regulators consisting of a CheY-like receiver domain and a winged-helix DNA-binding domain